MTMRPTPASTASASSSRPFVVAVEVDGLHAHAGRLQHGDLAAGDGVEAEALLGDEARERPVQERLRGVQHVGLGVLASERVRGSPRTAARSVATS